GRGGATGRRGPPAGDDTGQPDAGQQSRNKKLAPGHPAHARGALVPAELLRGSADQHQEPDLHSRTELARAGGSAKYAEKLRQEGKLPVRRRLELLLDPGIELEDGLLAHADEPGYGADGVVTVVGKIDGRTVCAVAKDPNVKAGACGPG